MPRHTKLKLLNGRTLCEWVDATGCYSCIDNARLEIADAFNCRLGEVEEIETEGGEFLAINGDPVAFLESKFVPMPAMSTISAVDLRPLLARA